MCHHVQPSLFCFLICVCVYCLCVPVCVFVGGCVCRCTWTPEADTAWNPLSFSIIFFENRVSLNMELTVLGILSASKFQQSCLRLSIAGITDVHHPAFHVFWGPELRSSRFSRHFAHQVTSPAISLTLKVQSSVCAEWQ